jgi:hypothetical protein
VSASEESYFRSPGDGRPQACIPATALVWALLMGTLLRRLAFAAIEDLVGSEAQRAPLLLFGVLNPKSHICDLRFRASGLKRRASRSALLLFCPFSRGV